MRWPTKIETVSKASLTPFNPPITYSGELVVDGGIDDPTLAAWSAFQGAELSRVFSFGAILQVTYVDDTFPTTKFAAEQTILTVGRTYRAQGRARGIVGTPAPRVYGTHLLWTSPDVTTWQYFDVTFVATGTEIQYGTEGAALAEYVNFDDLSVVQESVPPLAIYDMKPAGAIVPDLSPNGNDATIEGPTHSRTILGDAMQFDGVNDYLNAGNDASLDATNAITISTWCMAHTLNHAGGGNVPRIIRKPVAYDLYVTSAGVLTFITTGVSDTTSDYTGFPIGQWVHVVATYAVATGIRYLYVNGTIVDTEAGLTGSIATSVNNLQIGSGTPSLYFWHGLIAAAAIYSDAKDQEWVTAEYAKGLPAGWHSDW